MKRRVMKFVATGLTLTTAMSLVACGTTGSSNNTATTAAQSTAATEVTKPENFSVMVNNSVISEANGGKAFYDQLAEKIGCTITWIRPDHSGYYDAIGNAFNSQDTMPDVVRLDENYYTLYAAGGYLWDMTDAWLNSETRKSGRLISSASAIEESNYVYGLDGEKRIYGFSPARGNGCVTYMKETWLKAAGYTKADVENKTLTFDEYYKILKDMQAATNKSVISCAGYISTEVPYTNYLPEFYQQARYTFYQNAAGEYVDGFTEQAMKDALGRIRQGVADGVIDQESVNNSTANARDKFYADETGVFSYWAGTWANTLKVTLANKGLDDSLIAIKPVKELGKYTERVAQTWCITSAAENPEGIFKYFIDTMLDGGDVQTLWTYGAKGTHWDTKAETVTLTGKEDQAVTYKEGEFHYLPSPENPSVLQQKNCIDANLSIGKFTNGDPGAKQIPETASQNQQFFADNSQVLQAVPMTDELGDNISDINKQRNVIITAIATGTMTVDEGMAEYTNRVGKQVEEVLNSLKALNKK